MQAELFNNCYALYCTRIVAKVAAILGDTASVAKYEALATAHATAIHTKFYIPGSHGWVGTSETLCSIPIALDFPLLCVFCVCVCFWFARELYQIALL
jgi:hypothetical protein